MTDSKKVLLVEGDADTFFFSACCRQANLADVSVGPPREFNGTGTGKGNALTLFPNLIEAMEDERVTHLGLIVDADYSKTNGLGYEQTLQKVKSIVTEKGYEFPDKPDKNKGGYIFHHSDGLPDVGLWIMPNNGDEGFLEDFIRLSMVSAEAKLFATAKSSVASLENPKFKPHHVSKADVATWLAWQSVPGKGLHSVIGGNLLNFKKGLAKEFIDWLKAVYKT